MQRYIIVRLFQAVSTLAMVSLIVFSMNLFGDWLRDRLDPKLRQV